MRPPERTTRLDELRKLIVEAVPAQETDQQRTRRRPILAADAHRTEQHVISRVACDVLRDAFPQQQQRAEIPLIRSADERTSQLERRSQRAQERIAVGE